MNTVNNAIAIENNEARPLASSCKRWITKTISVLSSCTSMADLSYWSPSGNVRYVTEVGGGGGGGKWELLVAAAVTLEPLVVAVDFTAVVFSAGGGIYKSRATDSCRL